MTKDSERRNDRMDENRIKSMIRLAAYENGEGGQDLLVHRYSLRDYVIKDLIKTFFLTTVGYGLLLLLVIFGNLTSVTAMLTKVDMGVALIWLLVGYAAVMVLYMTISFNRSRKRYLEEKRSVKAYGAELKRLEKMSGRESK